MHMKYDIPLSERSVVHCCAIVQVSYMPNTVNVVSVVYYTLTTQGGVSKTTIKCMGRCKGQIDNLYNQLVSVTCKSPHYVNVCMR